MDRARHARHGKQKKSKLKVVKALNARKRKVSNAYRIEHRSLTIANQAKIIKKLRKENQLLKARIAKLVNNKGPLFYDVIMLRWYSTINNSKIDASTK